MPGVQDRAEILEVMFRGVELEAGLELGEVAEACVGMTGADLRGLVYTATLAARQRTEQPIRGQIDQSEAGETVRVSQDDITQALASTHPSVTPVMRSSSMTTSTPGSSLENLNLETLNSRQH